METAVGHPPVKTKPANLNKHTKQIKLTSGPAILTEEINALYERLLQESESKSEPLQLEPDFYAPTKRVGLLMSQMINKISPFFILVC